MRKVIIVAILLPGLSVLAQQSASYKLEETIFNAGGLPEQGTVLTSSSYRIHLQGVGEVVMGAKVAGAHFQMEGGLVGSHSPAGEVTNLTVGSDQKTLIWSPEGSVGTYNVYRDLVGSLPGTYGACLQSGLTANSEVDPAVPAVGQAFFYLVTARNRIGEEGTKGYDSAGRARGNPAPCP